MRPFIDDARDESKKWKREAKIPERPHLQNIEQTFSLAEDSPSGRGPLGDIALTDNPQRRSTPNKRDRISTQEVEVINRDDVEVASLPTKETKS